MAPRRSPVGDRPTRGPLGLAAFAMTTFVLSMFNSNLVDAKGTPVVLGLALAYGGIVQLVAGLWEFPHGKHLRCGRLLLVFILLTATFILLAIGASGAHESVTHWGGYIGLATAAAAWYASCAAVINSTFGRTVAPVFPLAPVRE